MTAVATNNTPPPTKLDAGFSESLFTSVGLAIIAADPEGRITAWNPAAARLFGESGAAFVGAPLTSCLPEADRPAADERLRQCLSSLESVEFRARLGGTDADPIEYAVYITPVFDAEGALRGVAMWFRDITARLRLQRALKKHERLSSLGALAGGVAHHYNNLLCSIATSVEYAMNMNTMTAMKNVLRRANEAISRAGALTQQLMAFAEGDYRSADLADLTETVLYFFDDVEPRLNEKNIRLVLDWQKIPLIPVRREHLIIILRNLVDNSAEVMPAGGTLSVSLARRDHESVCLSISDTGGGINAEDMEHLFEPFHSTKARLGCGVAGRAGLGLAVVHGLVREMHGNITAGNVPGRGARFDIVLPTEIPNP